MATSVFKYTKDLMKAKLLAGHLDISSDEKLKMALQIKQQAFVMTIIRGGVQGTLTGGSYRWERRPGGELYMNPEELVKSDLTLMVDTLL